MSDQRQSAFRSLRPVCVELSSVALRFRAKQASVKAVLLALQPVHDVLQSLGEQNLLDEKLAEYAFFPLTHLLNHSRQLSSRCLELTVECVETLVAKGWRQNLAPEMGKQLLILMGLLVSGPPDQHREPASDELLSASFQCISVILRQLGKLETAHGALKDFASKGHIDQLVYQLLEAMSTASSEQVQINAANALRQLFDVIPDPIFLASLLPRTVSTLVKVLRPSNQARRTRKVLICYLDLLRTVLTSVMSDREIARIVSPERSEVKSGHDPATLDSSWLSATAAQIEIALTQVLKLRTMEATDVAQELLNTCTAILEDCFNTLKSSLPILVETVVVLCRNPALSEARSQLKRLVISRPEIVEILNKKLYDWSQALPRVMQGNDDRPKEQILGQLSVVYTTLLDGILAGEDMLVNLASILIESVSAAVSVSSTPTGLIESKNSELLELVPAAAGRNGEFPSLVLSHQSQQGSTSELQSLIASLGSQPGSQKITRNLIEHVRDPSPARRLSAMWLALAFLRSNKEEVFDFAIIASDDSGYEELSLSRPMLISDLYNVALLFLLERENIQFENDSDWRMTSLSLECLVLQATQLGESYRPELMDTLFPVLSLMASPNKVVQQHAMTTLNLLASACEYQSASSMLIENVDYMVNAIALRLNSFDVSRSGLQVLHMMIRLCGARLIPYLDDLTESMFGALDNFHGYPQLVEELFEILKAVVDESSANATLAITAGMEHPKHKKGPLQASGMESIMDDLRETQRRKRKLEEEDLDIGPAPHRPWKLNLGEPKVDPEADDLGAGEDENTEDQPVAPPADESPVLSPTHRLLISIAQAAVPHMASPSSAVRSTLLELFRTICPLLAGDENSFLPLVNSIWPALVPRLFSRLDDETGDTAFNVRAAAITMSVIFEAAGDFMASRVDAIFNDLEALFKRTSLDVKGKRALPSKTDFGQGNTILITSEDKATMQSSKAVTHMISDPPRAPSAIRTSSGQILDALVRLLVSILNYVRISADNSDRIFDMLSPLMQTAGRPEIREALVTHNADHVWLIEQTVAA